MLISVRYFFVLSFLSLPAFASDNAINLLKIYFESNAVCSVAEVRKLTQYKNDITIFLEVESSTREALSTMAAESRDAWMALHCPPIGHNVWNKKYIKDYFIETPISTANTLRVSCGAYFDSVLQRKKSAERSVAARIRELLGTTN